MVILLISGGTSSHLLVFSEDLFFIYLLPLIIFNAGFQVKKKQFFRNFITIMLFGALGTLISFVIISLGKDLFLLHFFFLGSFVHQVPFEFFISSSKA
ncbi:unnamed protein product [Coffea canephora]|uniref:Cation/H+ exchanger transmembrane domain-containing protein n=1 Tax=Coffea canephora TaxID=49390 RepID=A0A068US42_COFCA|nr:unnamed protein product [Coffea canephora]